MFYACSPFQWDQVIILLIKLFEFVSKINHQGSSRIRPITNHCFTSPKPFCFSQNHITSSIASIKTTSLVHGLAFFGTFMALQFYYSAFKRVACKQFPNLSIKDGTFHSSSHIFRLYQHFIQFFRCRLLINLYRPLCNLPFSPRCLVLFYYDLFNNWSPFIFALALTYCIQ